MQTGPQITVLFWIVLVALVAVVAVIAVLLRSGRSVPPFAGGDGERRPKRGPRNLFRPRAKRP